MSVFAEISQSVDGFVAGPDPSLENPLGRNGEALHEWIFGLRAWREPHGREGGVEGPENDLVQASQARTGAVVMGRRMFSGGSGLWEDDPNANGWWGDEPPFRGHVWVLTHHEREDLTLGQSTFHFFTGGVEAAVAAANDAAGDKDVIVAGGAEAIRGVLAAGLLDELVLHTAPVVLGGGTPLFDGPLGGLGLELIEAQPGEQATHARYRVTR